jgi:hypothetical protein
MCATLTCHLHPDAVCVTDDCSCEVWFIDVKTQERVDCEKDTVIPPVFFDMVDDIDFDGPSWPDEFDVDTSLSQSSSSQTTADAEQVVSPAKEEDQVSSVDVTIIVVATASVVLIVLAIVAVLLYKAAQKKKNSSTVKSISRQQEEQLKPLNESVPHIT